MTYWMVVRYHVTGREQRIECESALQRALRIIMLSSYADVVEQGESPAVRQG